MNDILMAKAAVSAAELEFYAGNPSWTVRCEVASNWFASSELLNTFAHDFRWEVQACVAENPNTNKETFEYLLEQGREDVLWYIAGSATAPEHCRVRAAEKLAGNDIEDAFFRRKITSAMKELVLKNQKSNIA